MNRRIPIAAAVGGLVVAAASAAACQAKTHRAAVTREGLPDGFTLDHIAPTLWRLTLPNRDGMGGYTEGPDYEALRRSAWLIDDLARDAAAPVAPSMRDRYLTGRDAIAAGRRGICRVAGHKQRIDPGETVRGHSYGPFLICDRCHDLRALRNEPADDHPESLITEFSEDIEEELARLDAEVWPEEAL